jgi:hypothetical protein
MPLALNAMIFRDYELVFPLFFNKLNNIFVMMTAFSCSTAAVVIVVMVAADAAGRNCGEQQRTIDRVFCISRKKFSLIIPSLSSADILRCNSCFAWLQPV